MNCRQCGSTVSLQLIDLGSAPPSNALRTPNGESPENSYPLRVLVCEQCWLTQTEDFARAEDLFDPAYAYLSGYSRTWIDHCEELVERVIGDFSIARGSRVVEVATNDGTLLSLFAQAGMRCLGIEPTPAAAAIARDRGLEVIESFLDVDCLTRFEHLRESAQLVVANNVLAHVPDIVGFACACRELLTKEGIVLFEFQHLLQLVEHGLFDTIYHEHFSYLSLLATVTVLDRAGLTVFHVEEIPTHGGSLRVLAQPTSTGVEECRGSVRRVIEDEKRAGMDSRSFYSGLQEVANTCRDQLVDFLLEAKKQGKVVVGYGAAAKGNTLLNYAGIDAEVLRYVVDKNPIKQGMCLPGSGIPIVSPEQLRFDKPDCILILPWNISEEVCDQLRSVNDWSGELVVAVPELRFV